jgi:ankyrin repeat protein
MIRMSSQRLWEWVPMLVARDENGRTPPVLAFMDGVGAETIRSLIAAGADVNARDKNRVQNMGLIELLLHTDVTWDGVGWICVSGTVGEDVVSRRVNDRDIIGRTPLFHTIECNPNPDVIRLPLTIGASVDTVDSMF